MNPQEIKQRIYSIDLLRGVVMMIMMLDHVREFVHAGALTSDPSDPATTTVPVFFTRWITHFCAPTFVFLSGVSIYLQRSYGKTNSELSRFLLTRGLWLVLLEFTVVRFGIVFNLDYTFLGLVQVIWVIGVSMIIMAALIYLPIHVVGIAGVMMIAFHNLLDGFNVPPNIAFTGQSDLGQSLWIVFHQIGFVQFGTSGVSALFVYAIVPWVGVMMAGFWLGSLYERDAEGRRRILLTLGAIAVGLFVVLRLVNLYGDPVRWQYQENSVATALSFFNVTKYPPSLLFLLMTLGPVMIVLALTDRIDGRAVWQRVAINFGRVPMFYYILQWYWAHGVGVLLGLMAAKDVGYLFLNIPNDAAAAPPGYGFPLAAAYAVWVAGLIALYPLCVWWGKLKQRNKHWLLGYL